ncbi:MAG: tetratricopeptide repeat protein [Candidatus Competibacteraceae bacterium]
MQDNLDDLFGGLERASAPERLQPFKFLDPYGPEDRAIFFGREPETAMLYAQFFKSRLTLVYGESGTGKTSLIDCGLRAQIPPEDMLFIPVRTALDPETALRQALLKQAPLAEEPPADLEALLREVIQCKHKTLALVFDQFEEFFLFQPASVRQDFARQMAAWLEHSLDLRLLIGIRQEYLAQLTELEEWLPDLYQNRLWVRRMSREQAQAAITGPCQALGIAIEPELVAELLDTLTAGGQGVELPILQVVLDTLYRRAVADDAEHPRLTHAGYQALGQVQNILAQFIEERVSAYQEDAEVARQVLKTLVTAEGTRRLSSPAEMEERLLQFGAEIPTERLLNLLRRLGDDRIVREDADHHLFELRHDALAARIWQWMTGIEQELLEVRQTLEHRLWEYRQRGRLLDSGMLDDLKPYESRLHLRGELAELVEKSKQRAVRARRRRRGLLIAGLVVGWVSAGFAFVQWDRAKQEKSRAEQARKVAIRAQGQAEKLINHMLFDLRDKLEPLGRLDLLEQAAQGALDYYDQLPDSEMTADALRRRGVALNNIADVFQAKGDLGKALTAYQASLTIAERLAQQDPTNTEWQRDLAISHERIGNVRQAQGDLAGALTTYQATHAIFERLAQQDPANAQWQRDLSISHERIGDVRQAQSDLAGALAAYQASLTIAERLAQQDPANAGWQRDLAVSHDKIGDVRHAQRDLASTLAAYQAALAIRQRLAQQGPANTQWQLDLALNHDRISDVREAQGDISGALDARKATLKIARDLHEKQQDKVSRQLLAQILGDQSFTLLFNHQFKEAIAAAEEALALDPSQLWIVPNQAHGYLLSGQFEKAKAIYRQHARDEIDDQRTFAATVLDDFAKLRQHGIDHPDMKKIEVLLRTSSSRP